MTDAAGPTKSTIWTAVIAERRRLVHDLQDLNDMHWSTETACTGWDVHDVLAHLVDTALTTRISFVKDLLAARMDFDRANEIGVARTRRDDPRDTLAELATVADRRTGPPAALATRLVEAFVHGEDIRRALGTTGQSLYPPQLVAQALRYQAKASAHVGGGRERVAGLRLVAEDVDCTIGEGALVSGSALALLLAVSGRPVAEHELHGPGAAELSS